MKDSYPGVYPATDTQGKPIKDRWVLRMCITVNNKNHRISRSINATSKKKAYEQKIKLLEELKHQLETGTTNTEGMDFKALVDKWKSAKSNDYSPTTYNEYLKLLDNHILSYFGDIKIKSITKGTIYEFMDYKKQSSSLSDKSIRNIVMLISSILSFAEDREWITVNPCIRLKLKKEDTKIKPQYFNYQQMEQIKSQLDLMVENKKKSFDNSIKYSKLEDNERDKIENIRLLEVLSKRLFVNLCIITGARRGEVIGLKWSDIEFAEVANIEFKGTAYTVVSEGTKIKNTLKNNDTGKIVYITDKIIPMIKEYKALQTKVIKEQGWKNKGYVFITLRNGRTEAAGELARPNTYTHWFKLWCQENKRELGLSDKEAEAAHVHMLRHSFVSYNLNSGVNLEVAAELSGHKDKSVTANIYGHGYEDLKIEAARIFDDLYDSNNSNN